MYFARSVACLTSLIWLGSASAQTVTLVAGPTATPPLVQPFATAIGPNGTIYFVEMVGGERLRAVAPDGTVTTLAGTGKKQTPGSDGPAESATFNGMHDLARTRAGTLYLADTFNNRVRLYDPTTKSVSPIAEGFKQAICLALTSDEKTLYVCDIGNRQVKAVDLATKTVRVIAGTGQKGEPKNGESAVSQPLVDPRALALDASGNLYLAERGGHRLRVIRPDGTIQTVAGTGKAGKGGDGGPALSASLNGPKYLSACQDGSILIADTENHQIRRYIPGQERMELVAGTGKRGGQGVGGSPLQVELNRPHGVQEDPKTGDILIADSENHRILRIRKGN
jgi:sugar lactone lactonase YvrE